MVGHRYLGWQTLADVEKYRSGLVPISGYGGYFLAIEGRLSLRAELSLLKKLAHHAIASGDLPIVERHTVAIGLTGDALEEPYSVGSGAEATDSHEAGRVPSCGG